MSSLKLQIKKVPSALLAATAIAGLLLLPVAPRSYADEHSKCQHAIEKAESNLDHAIHKHGEHSPEADSRRRELNDERQHCWDTYHGWWDGHAHVWHTDRDWDHP
jgi:hypothetical protein